MQDDYVSHLQFADDTLFLLDVKLESVRNSTSILKFLRKWSSRVSMGYILIVEIQTLLLAALRNSWKLISHGLGVFLQKVKWDVGVRNIIYFGRVCGVGGYLWLLPSLVC